MGLKDWMIGVTHVKTRSANPRLGKHGDKEMLSIPISREDFVRTGTGVIVCRKNRFFNPTKDMTLIGFGSGRRLRTPEREAVLN
jgi:hypothetical protein